MLHIASMGVETAFVGVGAVSAAGNGSDPPRLQPPARELVQIALPAATGVGDESDPGASVLAQEGRAHILAHFELRGGNGRPQPGVNCCVGCGFGTHHRQGRLDDTAGKSAPSGVDGGNDRAIIRCEQHGQAVRRQHGADAARSAGHRRISGQTLRLQCIDGCIQIGHDDAMHLCQPHRRGGHAGAGAQSLAIGLHRRRVIAHMRAEIQRCIGRGTQAAGACG